MNLDKEIALAVIKSPLCLGILAFMFTAYLIQAIVAPLVQVVTQTIPSKMEVIISKQDTMIHRLDEYAPRRMADVPRTIPPRGKS